ncbi:MAG: TIGR00282 family metallophosphoesterase [Alphaproteobacteria bacterium]|nr:TIGR00282 family metallophosphoesterase [Alphaproteobacteria bacterium]
MRILFLGDVVGRAGKDAVIQKLPLLKEKLSPDVTIINAENAAGGFGLTVKIADALFDAGIDCITLGNHAWDQTELLRHIDKEPRVLRPLNYPVGTPGKGFHFIALKNKQKLLVINIMATILMSKPLNDPFEIMRKFLEKHPLSGDYQIFVDFHGEATSEKMAMGHALDGRVTAVIGTHTHIPTADEHILPNGTAYMSDAGMCGDYDSVIGMRKEISLWGFEKKTPPIEKREPAKGEASVCGALIISDDATGKAVSIEPVRIGGILKPTQLNHKV